jgi:hypothetical protein
MNAREEFPYINRHSAVQHSAMCEAIDHLRGVLAEVSEHLRPIQPNSMGMTSYELGWADCQAEIRAVMDRVVSPVDGDDDGDDADADEGIQ